jgi:predicted Zn-dependent protease
VIWITMATLVFGGLIGYVFYKPWRLKRLDRDAREAMNQKNYLEASLKARVALRIDPQHLAAYLIMAELSENIRDEKSVDWRERITQLTGGSTASLIAYASTAARFGKYSIAKSALDQVPDADKRSANFQAVAGTLALDSGDFAAAESCFAKAAEFDPADVSYRFALAKAQLGSSDFFKQESGRKILTEVGKLKDFRLRALRELVTNYATTGEPQAALRECRALIADPDHTFSDDLQFLQLLHAVGDEGFPSALAEVKQRAAANAKYAGALLVWMGNAGLALDALNWALKDAPDVGKMPGLEPGFAGCYLTLENWPKLLNATAAGPWPDAEYIRHAYRAKASREQNLGGFTETEWQAAINAAATLPAANQPSSFAWLARMAKEWGWPVEEEKALWAVIGRSPRATWALEALYRRYLREKNTLGIRNVAAHLLKIDSSNETAQNDFALASVLLDHEADRARDMASGLYRKHPENVVYASTYAFALLAGGQANRALQVLETLPPAELETPAVAAYYGMALAAADAPDKARRFLTIARDATFLPEEQAWIAKAERQISLPSPAKP